MIKDYIKQIYTEGLATIFYLRPVKYFEQRIKNKKMLKIVICFIKVLYTIIIILLAGYILYKKLFK